MNEEARARALARWLEDPTAPLPPELEADVVASVSVLQPNRAPPPRVTAEEILAAVETGPLAERAPGALPEPANHPRRWLRAIGGASGAGLVFAMAATLLLVSRAALTPDLTRDNAAPAAREEVAETRRVDTGHLPPPPAAQRPSPRPRAAPAPTSARRGASAPPQKAKQVATPTIKPSKPATVDPTPDPIQRVADGLLSSGNDDEQAAAFGGARIDQAQAAGRDAEITEAQRMSQDAAAGFAPEAVEATPEDISVAAENTASRMHTRRSRSHENTPTETSTTSDLEPVSEAMSDDASQLDILRSAVVPPARRDPTMGLDREIVARHNAAQRAAEEASARGAYREAGDALSSMVVPPPLLGQMNAIQASTYYLQAGDPSAASALTQRGLALSSAPSEQHAWLLVLLGDARRALGDPVGAATAYRSAAAAQ